MSDPVGLDPTFGIAPMVEAAFTFMGTAMETRKARIETEAQERERLATLERDDRWRGEDNQRADREYQRDRLARAEDRLHDLDADRQRDRDRQELQNYPISGGPGALRESIRLVEGDLGRSKPLVLLVPSASDDDPAWRSIPARVESALGMFQNHEVLVARLADRPFSWPDHSLVRHDLQDLATIVVSVKIAGGMLEVRLGGCNLGGPRVQQWWQVAWVSLPGPPFWTGHRLDALERTSPNGFARPPRVDDADGLRMLQTEWATRLAVLAVVAAADAYNLHRRIGYDEQIDVAAAMLGPEFGPRFALPAQRGQAADPAYHFLHTARRLLHSGDVAGAAAAVDRAVNELEGTDAPSRRTDDAISDRVRDWHRRMLHELAALPDGSAVVPAPVLRALTAPAAKPQAAPARRTVDRVPEKRRIPAIRHGDEADDPFPLRRS